MSLPLRTCIGCRAVDEQSQLMRWVVDASHPERVIADPNRSKPGRGAWLHPTPECAHQAVRRRGFARAFRSGGIAHELETLLTAIQEAPRAGATDRSTQTESGSGKVETR